MLGELTGGCFGWDFKRWPLGIRYCDGTPPTCLAVSCRAAGGTAECWASRSRGLQSPGDGGSHAHFLESAPPSSQIISVPKDTSACCGLRLGYGPNAPLGFLIEWPDPSVLPYPTLPYPPHGGGDELIGVNLWAP